MLSLGLMLSSAMPTAALPVLRSMAYPHLDAVSLRAPPSQQRGPPPRYFKTLQDHFDAGNKKTWNQAYYVNDTFWDGSGPVFLCVGGEGPAIDGSAVTGSVHCNVAVEYLPEAKALMFAVEHRYYGCHNMSACPYSHSDPEPLKWLSSRQALADLAAFHAYAAAEYSLSPANKWVSFGGSYPGMLAGWFRVMYPQLVHASISSSAPVHAKLDMREYFDIAARAYSLPSVGGSEACEGAIRKGHEAVGLLMNSSSGRDRLATLFDEVRQRGADWLTTRTGQAQFAGNGVASFPSQSNDPSCSSFGCNIQQICEVMVGGTNASAAPIQRLAALANHQLSAASRHPFVSLSLPFGTHETAAEGATLDGRALRGPHGWLDYWGYQTCTEFGFYQTCEFGSRCFFVQGLNLLHDDDDFCQTDYGIAPADIQASIDHTNRYYGALRPDLAHNATRILYVNGNVDPWSGLSILTSPTAELPVLEVEGASHHAWTHPSMPDDQPSVNKARAAIRNQIKAWLAADDS